MMDSYSYDTTILAVPANFSLAIVSVVTGTRTIVVPCSDWLTRQPEKIQMLCLVDLVLAVMFVLNALLDMRAWLQRRRRLRQAG